MKDEMDILREVGSISAAHGSIALSQILGRKINLRLPSLDVFPVETILNKLSTDQIVISVSSHILTQLKGYILFILDEKSAFKLIDICYKIKKNDKEVGSPTEMGMSLIKEVGGVVIASYIGSLSIMLNTLIIPSIPTLTSGPIQEIIGIAVSPYSREEYILLIEAIFEEAEKNIKGSFYLILSPEAMRYIQDACKKILKSLEVELKNGR